MEEGPDGFGPNDLRVTFDPTPDAGSAYYVADHIVVHPAWFTASVLLRQLEERVPLARPRGHRAGLPRSTVAGVTPAPIAGPGYLDRLNLKTATFTVAGYGTDAYITGSAAAPN